MRIQLLVRQYARMIGLARYSLSLQESLSQIGVEYSCVEPAYPFAVRTAGYLLRPMGYDLKTFFTNYPVAAKLEKNTVKHLTVQMMASLLSFKPGLRRVVVTVHDIVPYLVRNDPHQSTFSHPFDRFFDHLAMHNLRKADLLITDSTYTKKMLVRHLSCSPEKIRVVQLGLDQQLFHPVPVDDTFHLRYSLKPGYHYLLYVGSENPRKNLAFLVQALAQVKERVPNIKLLKVGGPEYLQQHHQFVQQIADLHLEDTVIFLNYLAQEDLTALYSAVDGFVFPSLYEGFGLPLLEAMACGAPVVCSTAASLPEVVGDAALTVDPTDKQGWVDAMERILLDDQLRMELSVRGLDRAREFTWERTARQTLAVYRELL